MSNVISNINAAKQDTSINDLLALEGNFTIILADDDADDRELFEEALTELYPKIFLSTKEDGIELMDALNNAKENQAEIIFLDMNMPRKSGKKCLEEIKRNPDYANTIVIIYSTSSSPKDIDETYKMGANLYLRKPNSYKQLLEWIKTIFSLPIANYHPTALKKNFVLNSGQYKIAHD